MRRSRTDIDNRSEPASREVNSLLHTLRGEQFRHSQNVRRSKAHLTSVDSHSYNKPSLPFSDIYKDVHAPLEGDAQGEHATPPPLPVIHEGRLEYGYLRGPVPGPPIPKSWSGLFSHDPVQDRNTLAFRREALSLVFSHATWSFGSSDVLSIEAAAADPIPAVPPLTQVCLGVILAEFPNDVAFTDELLPVLPPHFRRHVLRHTAVHDPLSNGKLYALCEPEGHTDGELIVVGPQATLQRDLLARSSPISPVRREGDEEAADDREEGPSRIGGPLHTQSEGSGAIGEVDSWEVASGTSQDHAPLHTLVVLNAAVSLGALFAFPLTLTRLALLALAAPAPIHRLPRICPLLEVLDLSYNPWLNDPPGGKGSAHAETILERIQWEKWTRLQVLGMRACNVPKGIVSRVNNGRWEEVEVIGVEERTFGSTVSVVEGMMKSPRLSD